MHPAANCDVVITRHDVTKMLMSDGVSVSGSISSDCRMIQMRGYDCFSACNDHRISLSASCAVVRKSRNAIRSLRASAYEKLTAPFVVGYRADAAVTVPGSRLIAGPRRRV